MEIITEKGDHFDIPAGFEMEFEFINPIFDNVGSQTVPATLPYTPNNLRILDFPNRFDRRKRYMINRNVTLREGPFQKRVTQAVFKANPKDRIVTSFYMDEAIFYEKIKNVKLPSIHFEVDPRFPTADNHDIQSCMDFIFSIMIEREESHFHVFPVLTKWPDDKKFYGDFGFENMEILNRYYYSNPTTQPITYKAEKILDWEDREDEIDDAEITYPKGYGITIFLKISYILESIAAHMGYTLGNNIFNTHDTFKRMVLLNDVSDTIVKGFPDYSQLVPDITIAEFITSLKNKIGLSISVDEPNRILYFNLLEDTLNRDPDFDLTPYATERPAIEWKQPEQIKLYGGTSFPYSKPEMELYEDFVKAHGEPDTSSSMKEGLIKYMTYMNYLSITVRNTVNYRPSFAPMSSGNFSYYTHDSAEYKELNADDEQMVVIRIPSESYVGCPLVQEYSLPLINGRRNLNSTLYIGGKAQKTDFGEMPTMYCFKIPDSVTVRASGSPYGYYATVQSEKKWTDYSLKYWGEDGLFNHFWQTYDQCLRNSFHTVYCPMRMPLSQLTMLNIHTPKLLFNQRVLIERIKCRIGGGKFTITEAIFRTLRSYDD